MNIDHRMVLDRDGWGELQRFMDALGWRMWDPEDAWHPENEPGPTNVRRRYYRLIDRTTGEPGVYGGHYISRTDVGNGLREVYFEHK